MSEFNDVGTINETLARAKAQGLDIPETALRRWVKDGTVPAVYVGKKALVYWPSLMGVLRHGGQASAQSGREAGQCRG